MGRILKSVLIVIILMVLTYAAIAATKIGTMGAPNSNGVYPVELYSDGSMKFTSASGTGVNWTDTKSLGSGVNWSLLDFQASKGINWIDTIGMTHGSGTGYRVWISADGTLYLQ